MGERRVLGAASDEGIPEVDVGLRDRVEDAGGVGDVRGKGDAERDEAGYDEVVLLRPFVDDLGVDLLEVSDSFADSEQKCERQWRLT